MNKYHAEMIVWSHYLTKQAPEGWALYCGRGGSNRAGIPESFRPTGGDRKFDQATVMSESLRHQFNFCYFRVVEVDKGGEGWIYCLLAKIQSLFFDLLLGGSKDKSKEEVVQKLAVPIATSTRIKRMIKKHGAIELALEILEEQPAQKEEYLKATIKLAPGNAGTLRIKTGENTFHKRDISGETINTEEIEGQAVDLGEAVVNPFSTMVVHIPSAPIALEGNKEGSGGDVQKLPVPTAKRVHTLFQKTLIALSVLSLGSSFVLYGFFAFHWIVLPVGIGAAIALLAFSIIKSK